MENFIDDYQFWETSMFLLPTEELDSWGLDKALSGTYYESSSPDGAPSSFSGSKNIVSERNRRKNLNERLFALRAVVPNISKMDKASIIKDAIEYIQELHEQEKRVRAEISQLKSSSNHITGLEMTLDVEQQVVLRSKKKKMDHHCRQFYDSSDSCCVSPPNPIQDLEMRVSFVGEKTVVVSLTCGKRVGTMVKLCEIFESLKLKIITAHITAFSGRLLKTIFVEADEREKDHLRIKIETVISSLT